jgi:hypothetical protein
VLAIGTLALAAACADEASAPENASSPTPTFDPYNASPTPSATAVADLRPQLEPGVKQIGGNRLTFSLGTGIAYPLDPYAFELSSGEERPPCESFVFVFSWQVLEPSAPPEDIGLAWQHAASGNPVEIARGANGTQTVGCGGLTALNQTGGDLVVLVDYVIGSTGG